MKPWLRKRIILTLIIIPCVYITLKVDSQPSFPQAQSASSTSSNTSVIHVAFVLKGEAAVQGMVSLLKSILFFQGRTILDRDACFELYRRGGYCDEIKTSKPYQLHVHAIVNAQVNKQMNEHFADWSHINMKWSIYDTEHYMEYCVDWLPITRPSTRHAILRLLVPLILHHDIDKAIVLDSNTLLENDIIKLWNMFDKFDSNQMLAYACKQQSVGEKCSHMDSSKLPPVGVSSAVALMHLNRLRSSDFIIKLAEAVDIILKKMSKQKATDETILNEFFTRYPETYFQLPCEWNAQIHQANVHHCCPVIWPRRKPGEEDCFMRQQRTADGISIRAVELSHFATRPLVQKRKAVGRPEDTATLFDRCLTYDEMITRYLQEYYFWYQIPTECFG